MIRSYDHLATVRALNAGSRGQSAHKRQGVGSVITIYGRRVFRATPNKPWGRSTQARSQFTHAPHAVYIAFLDGRMVGAKVRWRCGGDTHHFELLDEPTSPVCPSCLFALGRRAPVVNVHVHVS